MPSFRYDGPSHLFKVDENDSGTKRGAIGTFSNAMVDRYRRQGHRFTEVADLKPVQVAAAKEVAKE